MMSAETARRPPPAAKLALSAVAASIAETATYPLDFLKTQLQLQGELQAAPAATRRGLLATALAVVRTQGATALWRGLPAAVARHVPYTGIRITVFEQLKRAWAQHGGGDGGAPPLPINLAIGAASGALAQAAAVPFDLVKVRLQADGLAAAAGGAGAAPRYRGLAHALATVWREEGGRGLWAGSAPAVYRAALVNLGELTAYSQAKQAMVESGLTGGDNAGAHAASSLVSGFVASVVSTPADVLKTRLMNQRCGITAAHGGHRYRGVADCFVKTLGAEGWRGLYKGFLPTWARLGPWQLTFWVSYEQLRSLAGLEGF